MPSRVHTYITFILITNWLIVTSENGMSSNWFTLTLRRVSDKLAHYYCYFQKLYFQAVLFLLPKIGSVKHYRVRIFKDFCIHFLSMLPDVGGGLAAPGDTPAGLLIDMTKILLE